jgi:hypothetical protein
MWQAPRIANRRQSLRRCDVYLSDLLRRNRCLTEAATEDRDKAREANSERSVGSGDEASQEVKETEAIGARDWEIRGANWSAGSGEAETTQDPS